MSLELAVDNAAGHAYPRRAQVPAVEADDTGGVGLLPHTVHVMSHLFLCAYKHFSYDPPAWLDEGLAHAMEREVNPKSTTIDGDEGSGPHRGGHEDWTGDDKNSIRSGATCCTTK